MTNRDDDNESRSPDWRVGKTVRVKYVGNVVQGLLGVVVDAYPSGPLGIQDIDGVLVVDIGGGLFLTGGADKFVTA